MTTLNNIEAFLNLEIGDKRLKEMERNIIIKINITIMNNFIIL